MADLFNNTSNDYINPDLPSCPGDSDSMNFEFLPNRQAGIVSGSSILGAIDLSDISQIVTSWVKQTQVLQPGEVIYIQGLTKGISYKYQKFLLDGSVAYVGSDDAFYMSVDLSINYYTNFRYYQTLIHATGDYVNGIDIEDALNIEFGTRGISVTATYDASSLSFTGTQLGYNYNITGVDVSLFLPDTSIASQLLNEDASSAIPAFKYSNGAMLGYLLKVTYPTSITDEATLYIDINHTPDTLVYYEPSTGLTDSYVRYEKQVDVGMNAQSTDEVMSAADYLDYVQTNQKWEKVGILRAWLAAQDPENSNTKNLIKGFYLFNPQTFAVQIEYMTIL